MTNHTASQTALGRTGRLAALALSLCGIQPTWARHTPRSVAPEAAPAAWVAYAGRVNAKVTAWLTGSEDAAVRLKASIDASRPSADRSSAPLVLRLWIDRKGTITRVDFTPFENEQANTDLRSLVVGRTIGAVPPKGMLQPIVLTIEVDPAPPPRNTAGQTAAPPQRTI